MMKPSKAQPITVQLSAKASAEAVFSFLKDLGQAPLQCRASLGDLDAILQQQTTGLIDQRGALPDRQGAHAMDGLDVLLLDALDCHKAHIRSLQRFADRLGIGRIILVRLHKRLDELRGDQAHLMAVFSEPARDGRAFFNPLVRFSG